MIKEMDLIQLLYPHLVLQDLNEILVTLQLDFVLQLNYINQQFFQIRLYPNVHIVIASNVEYFVVLVFYNYYITIQQ